MKIFQPIEIAVAWLMVQFHNLFTFIGLDHDSGWTWALSIVGLTVVIRALLIPLFVKQIRSQRGMQMVQPEMKKIQQKYKGRSDSASRQAMAEEQMALYKRTGTNPFSSCLPLLLQMPIFFSLFRVLNALPDIAAGEKSMGVLDANLAESAQASTLFGAPLSATFMSSDETQVKIVTVILIILMSVATFMSSRQALTKNMSAEALDNPMARQQKMMMWILPGIFAVTGVNFPIGVLIYWLTSNVWAMGQQFFIIRNMPAPGTAAAKAHEERLRRKGKWKEPEPKETPAAQQQTGQRQQPKRKSRQQRSGAKPIAGPKGTSPSRPAGGGSNKPKGTAPSGAKGGSKGANSGGAQTSNSGGPNGAGKGNKSGTGGSKNSKANEAAGASGGKKIPGPKGAPKNRGNNKGRNK